MQLRRWVGLAVPIGLLAAFLGDPVDRRQLQAVLRNAAAGRPAMQGVAFVIPLIPQPKPSASPVPEYPDPIVFGEDVSLKYEDAGSGYWQTDAFSMLQGELPPSQSWQGQFLFKYDPPADPLHPGHEIAAINGSPFEIAFANLGQVDFAAVRDFRSVRWIPASAGELPAAWNLRPGDVIALRIVRNAAMPLPEASATINRRAVASRSFAKIYVRKLSHQDVRFDFVYQPRDVDRFPSPHRS